MHRCSEPKQHEKQSVILRFWLQRGRKIGFQGCDKDGQETANGKGRPEAPSSTWGSLETMGGLPQSKEQRKTRESGM